jgi:D-tagatose-1,6-bisphosphate aldolase subunit GatZ/KbaZ
VAEAAYVGRKRGNGCAVAPVYVIGTEVPPPGGSDEAEEGLQISKVTDLRETISITGDAFARHNLHDAWQRVIAVVVEPGVGHGDHTVVDYDREKAKDLTASIGDFPQLVFEGHTTDYQATRALREMVEDGIAILKVGPALTFAARETIFMLQYMEEELLEHSPNVTLSRFRETLDDAMVRNPRYWRGYYRGTEDEVEFARGFSLFDRARYYLVDEHVADSLSLLISNLQSIDIPLPLISQFLPEQHSKIREGSLAKDPQAFIRDRISDRLRAYSYAVGNRRLAT